VITTQRIQKLLAASYLEDMATRDLSVLRAMCTECRSFETSTSFYRRLAQARIEILEAERQRRSRGGSVEDLIADLPHILAGDTGRSGQTNARVATPELPEIELHWVDGAERLIADDTLTNLPALGEEELDKILGLLQVFERDLSGIRMRLHKVIDLVEREIATREAASASAPG